MSIIMASAPEKGAADAQLAQLIGVGHALIAFKTREDWAANVVPYFQTAVERAVLGSASDPTPCQQGGSTRVRAPSRMDADLRGAVPC